VKVKLFGAGGKVGSVLAPALREAGHELVELEAAEAMVDFTAPDVVVEHITAALEAGVACVVGTTGWNTDDVAQKAEAAGLPVFYAPNFAVGAVLMMRFAAEAAKHLARAEIVELHHETKVDAPSGTAKATADAMGGRVPIHSHARPTSLAYSSRSSACRTSRLG
jgi:4-hydroxy-tetrahydrodipicolinate reductase